LTKTIYIPFLLLITFGCAFSQDWAIGRNAMLVSGTVEYTKTSGDMYESDLFHRSTEFALNSSCDFFIVSQVLVGVRATLTRRVEGGNWKTDGYGGGPEIGLAFGNTKSQYFPYAKIGYQYVALHSEISETQKSDGVQTDAIFSAGILVPVMKHLGVTCECSYHLQSEKWEENELIKGNVFRLGFGLTGLFF
jgi:hypothetical protein